MYSVLIRKECNFDNGECCGSSANKETCRICACKKDSCLENKIGDGICNDENNNILCGFDDGDCCLATVDTRYCSKCICYASISGGSECDLSRFGDDDCDDINNNEICGYDGGDCCTDTTFGKCLGHYCAPPAYISDVGECVCDKNGILVGTKCMCNHNVGKRLNVFTLECEDCPLTDSDGSCVDECPDGKGIIYGSSYPRCMPCMPDEFTSSDKLYCVRQCAPGEFPDVNVCSPCPDGKLTSYDGLTCVDECNEANSEKENKHINMCGNTIFFKFLVWCVHKIQFIEVGEIKSVGVIDIFNFQFNITLHFFFFY